MKLAPIRAAGLPEVDLELVASGLGWGLKVPWARVQFRGVSGVASSWRLESASSPTDE